MNLSRFLMSAVFTVVLTTNIFADDHMEPAMEEKAVESNVEQQLNETQRKIDILAMELERFQLGDAYTAPKESKYGLGPAASKIYDRGFGLSFGGYGEVKYRNYFAEREDGAPSGLQDETDLHRIVLYTGFKFTDRLLLNAEIEFEHVDEISVEFAYVDALLLPQVNLRVGHLLVPMGIVNELHEPTTFFTVDRPQVDKSILPSTWHENGIGLFGDIGPVTYRTYVLTGLDASGFSASGIRGGRQKGSGAISENFAGVLRADFIGVAGLTVGGSVYAGNSGQGLTSSASGEVIDAFTLIYELHADWQWKGIHARTVAAASYIQDVAELNTELGLTGSDSIGTHAEGYYAELGYDVFSLVSGVNHALIPFVRWERLDTQQNVPDGFSRNLANKKRYIGGGLNYKPIDQVVVKVEYQNEHTAADTGVDQFRLGFGYIF